MAIVTVKSTQITNRDASPRVPNNSRTSGGRVRHARGACAVTSGDNSTSKYVFCSIPSNAVPISVRVSSPDIGTTTVGHFGLYKSTVDGGAVVDADFFKASVSLKDGAIAKSEIVNGNVVTLANAEKTIWEHLGLSADSGLTYDVALTLTADADATGTVQLEVDYAV